MMILIGPDMSSVNPKDEVNPVKENGTMSESSVELEAPSVGEFINLLLCCPKGGNAESCPLCEVRKLSFEEKVQWVMSQSKDEIMETLTFHQSCI